jgi:AraC-like DNA-binding protein
LNYREHAPSEALRRFISCYWTLRAPLGSALNRVLPDGCVDLLFDLGARSLEGSSGASFIGPMTRALTLELPRGVDLLGVRFRPGGGSAFLATGLASLRDASPPLDDLWGARQGSLLAERLAETDHETERLRLVDRELLERLAFARAPHPKVRAAVEALRRAPAGASIAGLSVRLGLGERQLQRLFLEHVGVGPTFFRRVMRLQTIVGALPEAAEQGWARLALDLGYADQAHLIRDVRALSGLSPTALGRERAMTAASPP